MVDYLKKWMYVNDVKNENLIKIGEIILKENKKPEIFTSQAEVLYYFWLLVNWKIKLETFFLFPDVDFSIKSYQYSLKNSFDAVYYVANLPNSLKDKRVFVFDKLYQPLLKQLNLKNSFVV